MATALGAADLLGLISSIHSDGHSHVHSPVVYTPPSPDVGAPLSLRTAKTQSSTSTIRRTQSIESAQNPFQLPVTSGDHASLLQPCDCVTFGRQVHGHALKTGFGGHEFLETKLLQMYARCGTPEEAEQVFEKMPIKSVYAWAGMCTLYTASGSFEKVLELFLEMQLQGVEMVFFIFPLLLKACSGMSALELGRQIHAYALKSQFAANIYVGNALIDMYGKCGLVDAAKALFQKMPGKDIVSWNSVISGCAINGMVYEALEYMERMRLSGETVPNIITWSAAIAGLAQSGYDEEALQLLRVMEKAGVKPNVRTLSSILPACARLENLSIGKEIHGYIVRHGYMSNSYIGNGLVDMFSRCGDMDSALSIFLKFSSKDSVSFNSMIVGYCENGEIRKAREFFDDMASKGIKRDTISWNSMISGYVDSGQFNEALAMFKDMNMEEGVNPDSFIIGSVLRACANMGAIESSKKMHAFAIVRGLHKNAFVGGALLEQYCTSGDIGAAQSIFNDASERDTATWNVLIGGYARYGKMEVVHQLLDEMRADGLDPNIYTWNGIISGVKENGNNQLALQLFANMVTGSLKPDVYTVGMTLHACSKLAAIEQGRQIHAYSVRCGYETHVHIGATLVDMYAKSGMIEYARLAFDRIAQHNAISQNSMLAGYAMHGQWEEGVSLFHQMPACGIKPDEVTFLSVLSLCSHAGSVDEGEKYFNMMMSYDVKPTLKHYTCMVDIYSRAGHLKKAYELMKKLPEVPDAIIWGSLLNGCVIHRNIELGEVAGKSLIELDACNTGNHVLLANLYASTGRWNDLATMWQVIKDRGLQKTAGCSWIQDAGQIHMFHASDSAHYQINEIVMILENLTLHMKQEGYRTTDLLNGNYYEKLLPVEE